ncbi:lipopolysaccharide assembly protein LapA domain-containing protein [Thermogemmatispora onikobensis]|uniref:lipopolysaccharide assembly protein LapA domain-containing protein n=1 Tax=Thermogemmatispora onikobensis TaxID=732234 RepID=UPI000A0564C8|nr:lipopolysaccharide assembly protein LapA domain-containing protein [Thermogemmatispora onikobensis]
MMTANGSPLSDVELSLFSWHLHIPLPLGVLLLLSFLLGALVFYVIAVLASLRDRRELEQLRKRVAELEREKAAALQAARIPSGPLPQMPPVVPMPGIPGMPGPGTLPGHHPGPPAGYPPGAY